MTPPFITNSDLLVQEDQDFVNNFVLTEEALARCEELVREREKSKSKSTLADVLLFSGSVAAVAGAVFFLSQVSHKSVAIPFQLTFFHSSTLLHTSTNILDLTYQTLAYNQVMKMNHYFPYVNEDCPNF